MEEGECLHCISYSAKPNSVFCLLRPLIMKKKNWFLFNTKILKNLSSIITHTQISKVKWRICVFLQFFSETLMYR